MGRERKRAVEKRKGGWTKMEGREEEVAPGERE